MWLVDEVTQRASNVVVQSAPPAIVTGLSWWGYSIQEWVYIATLVYILIGIFKPIAIWCWRKYERNK